MTATNENTSPIAALRVVDGRVVSTTLYAPGLPDGIHDLWPVSVGDARLDVIHARATQIHHRTQMPWDQALDLALKEAWHEQRYSQTMCAMVAEREALREEESRRHIIVPRQSLILDAGEHYAGIVMRDDGRPDYHLILVEGEAEHVTLDGAKEWAREAGGELPNRREQALLYANLKDQFAKAWYWSGEQHAAYPDYAWAQLFGNGYQNSLHKDTKLRARAVRRVPVADPKQEAA